MAEEKKKPNPNLLTAAGNTLLEEVLCVTDKEIQEFLTAEGKPVNAEKGDKPIGKLPNLATAFFVVSHRIAGRLGKKLEAFEGLAPAEKEKQRKTFTEEALPLKEQAELCKEIAWNLARTNLSERPDTIAYRQGGVVVSRPKKKGLFEGAFPHIHIIEVGILR